MTRHHRLTLTSLNLLGGRGREESGAGGSLFRRGSGRRKTEDLLNVLSNGHRAENVEEDEGTIRHVSACEVPMGNTLKDDMGNAHPVNSHERA